MRESKGGDDKDHTKEQECRGMLVVPYVRGLSEQFKRLATKHSFCTTFKDLKGIAQEPFGEKQKSVIYEITCKYKNAYYVGETSRLFKVRKKKHKNKVRLTNEDAKMEN